MQNTASSISDISTILLIMLLGYTGIAKLIDFKGFRTAIFNQPFPNEWGEIKAVAVPVIELAIVGLLLFRTTRLIGFIGALIMMTIFSVYVGLIWMGAFERTPCGCAGILDAMGWGEHLAVNIGFTLLAAFAILIEGNSKKIRVLPKSVIFK